jgi:hypothetical protein
LCSITTTEGAQQFRDVVEVQSRGGFVEEEQRAQAVGCLTAATRRLVRGVLAHCAVRKMAREFQTLRFAAGQGRDRLSQPQVVEADIDERRQAQADLGIAGKEFRGFRHGEVEDVRYAHRRKSFARQMDFEDLGPETPSVAVGTAQIDVGQELHLDVLEAVAAAGRTAPIAGIEAERARGVFAFERLRQLGE